MGMLSFREPLIVNGVKTAEGVRTLAILAGAANEVYAIDAENGTVAWQKKLKWASEQPQEAGRGRGLYLHQCPKRHTRGFARQRASEAPVRAGQRWLPAHHGPGVR